MAANLALCFLTATDCSEVERYAALDFTTSTTPTLAQVEDYAYDVAAILQGLTRKAGSVQAPPVSGVTPSDLARLLTAANAVGAAFLAWHQIYTLNGDERSSKQLTRLAGLWQSFCGEGAINTTAGLASLQYGEGGLIAGIIERISGSRLLTTPVSQGEVDLEDLSGDTQAVRFSRTDVD